MILDDRLMKIRELSDENIVRTMLSMDETLEKKAQFEYKSFLFFINSMVLPIDSVCGFSLHHNS